MFPTLDLEKNFQLRAPKNRQEGPSFLRLYSGLLTALGIRTKALLPSTPALKFLMKSFSFHFESLVLKLRVFGKFVPRFC